MAMPPGQFPIMLQKDQQQQQQQEEAQSYRYMYAADGRIGKYVDGLKHFGDQPEPHFASPWLAPSLLTGTADEGIGGFNLQFGYGVEPKKRKLEVQDFFENNSQISSLDILRPLSVSTGLGLSIDSGKMSSSGDSGLLSLIGEDISKELHQQDAEIDGFLKAQAERLKQAVLQKVQEQQLKTVSFVENKVLNKLREKESELRIINQKNMVLEERIEQVHMKVDLWKERAAHNENIMNALRHNLDSIIPQNGAYKEGFGDNELDDTAYCRNGRATELKLISKDNNSFVREMSTCKFCKLKEACMLLLPCKHLCLCKECETKLSICPQCCSSKFLGMEIYM